MRSGGSGLWKEKPLSAWPCLIWKGLGRSPPLSTYPGGTITPSVAAKLIVDPSCHTPAVQPGGGIVVHGNRRLDGNQVRRRRGGGSSTPDRGRRHGGESQGCRIFHRRRSLRTRPSDANGPQVRGRGMGRAEGPGTSVPGPGALKPYCTLTV